MTAQDLRKVLEQTDEKIILQMINNDNIMSGIDSYSIVSMIEKMSDSIKQQVLHNQEFIEKHQINSYDLESIISSLTEEKKAEVLMDIDLIKNKLHLEDYKITKILKELPSDEAKDKAIEIYQFENYEKIDVLKTCSDSHKLDILMKEESFTKYNIIDILQTLDIKTMSEFLVEQKEFCIEKQIHPYEIVKSLETDQQREFVERLGDIDLTFNEKKEILAILKTDVKQNLDTTNFPEEYKVAISMQVPEYGNKIIVDWERNLEDYRGLDNLIDIYPEKFKEEQRNKLIKLCDICPNMEISSTINGIGISSNATDYKAAEEWISSIINNLSPEYSKAQKMAVIDNAIGKKISYSPDFDTEVFDSADCRALWKIINSGYGVCNGIATVEKYIFDRVGIESEIISSGTHAFLKIKDIELPLANGESVKGNTIIDPTWDLTSHRFGGKPNNFCISYEEARKNDIDSEGKDHNCHKNDEQLKDATLNLDEQSLRRLFTSVDLADKDGNFPIKDLIEKSELIDKVYANQPEQNINKQLLLLKKTCPEFATCQNSSMGILSGVLLNNNNLKFNKCAVDRVYNRTDKEKRPIIFVYIDSDELEQKFYVADNKDESQFVEISQEEFTKQFECYEEDLKRNKRT